jgi:hypothetical protein
MKNLLLTGVFFTKDFIGNASFKRKQFYSKATMTHTGRLIIALLIFMAGNLFLGCKKDKQQSVLEQELSQLRSVAPQYIDIKNAKAAGYSSEVTGYRTQMGFHYLNTALLDDKFEISKPELLLYAPYGSDSLKFVAVEYATPIMDLNNPPPVPKGFTGSDDVWEINTEFKLWTLHVWVGLDNPHGIFAPHNPKLP